MFKSVENCAPSGRMSLSGNPVQSHWQRWRRPVRDFTCALVLFCAMFAVMSPTTPNRTPIPVISLLMSTSAHAALGQEPAASEATTVQATGIQSTTIKSTSGQATALRASALAASAPASNATALLSAPPKPSAEALLERNMPLISTILAIVFSSIIAFNMELLRHLRRSNAPSRHQIWPRS